MKSLRWKLVFVFCMLGWSFVCAPASSAAGDNDLNGTIKAAEKAQSRQDYGESIRLNSLLLSSPQLPAKDRPTAYYNRGLAYRATRQPELAIADFDQAIDLRSNFAEAYVFRAAAYVDKGEAANAIEDMRHAFRMKLPSKFIPEAHFIAGVAYAMNDERQNALVELNKAIGSDPEFAAAYHQRGLVRGMMGQYKEALRDLDRAIRIQPSFSVAYSDRGFVYLQMGNLDRALKDLDRAMSLGENDAPTHLRRGAIIFNSASREREADAIADFGYVIKVAPEAFPEAYAMRGRMLQNEGDDDKAISDYTNAIRLKSDYLKAYYNRALAYLTKGNWELAIKDLDRVLKLDSSSSNAYFFRGFSYAQEGAFAAASSDMNNAISESRDDEDRQLFLRTRGAIYFAEGNFDGARQDFERALNMSKGNRYAFLWLYLAGARIGKPLAAETLRSEGGQLDPKGWPDAAILFYLGKADLKGMSAAAENGDVRVKRVQVCELSFFQGEYELMRKNLGSAKRSLKRAADMCPNSSEVKFIAPRELQRIGG